MQALILSLWISQGILMFFDEFKYHHKRGLKKWERVGHPIDSFFFLLPFLYTQLFSSLPVFMGLCLFSSILITKDEFVHAKECDAGEQWLHSLLFILHPMALFGLWLAWLNSYHTLIQVQAVIIALFMFYQILYWNLFKGKTNEA